MITKFEIALKTANIGKSFLFCRNSDLIKLEDNQEFHEMTISCSIKR